MLVGRVTEARKESIAGFEPCPWLPAARAGMSFLDLRGLGDRRDADFYLTALGYAQCQWLRGLPAQAILQLDRAWGADLRGDEPVLGEWPSPYRALAWMLEQRPEGRFLGNPVRHFQHLATRVRCGRREVRSWRAWAGLHLSERILPADGYPRDERQIERESVVVPSVEEVREGLAQTGWAGEVEEWLAAWPS
jgi:hypothetical protein